LQAETVITQILYITIKSIVKYLLSLRKQKKLIYADKIKNPSTRTNLFGT